RRARRSRAVPGAGRASRPAVAARAWTALEERSRAAGILVRQRLRARRSGAAGRRADRDRLLLIPSAGFEISADEARQLCEALNRHFSEQFTLHAFAPDCWGMQAKSAMAL